MEDVTHWLESVSDAKRSIEAELSMQQARRAMMHSYGHGAGECVSCSKDPDRMRKVDAFVDFEQASNARIAQANRTIDEAMRVFDRMRSLGYQEARAANMLELVHVQLLSKTKAANSLYISLGVAKKDYNRGVSLLKEM